MRIENDYIDYKDPKVIEDILYQQDFNGINMSSSETKYYLSILNSCKDICDSDNKVNGESKGKILKMHFKRENNIIRCNGPMTIGSNDIFENRWINADIYIKKDSIVVDMLVTRIKENIQYRVLDEFTVKNNKLNRRSQYNYNMRSVYGYVENEEMKGRLR